MMDYNNINKIKDREIWLLIKIMKISIMKINYWKDQYHLKDIKTNQWPENKLNKIKSYKKYQKTLLKTKMNK